MDPNFYVSAPSSPSGCNLENLQFYSAPSSPIQRMGSLVFGYESETHKSTSADGNSILDDFEFETSLQLDDTYGFATNKKPEPPEGAMVELQKPKLPERINSFSTTMAFADELFCNGQVMSLKPPPRLQYSNDIAWANQASSPRSPSSVLRIPFRRRNAWNDNFDPFMVALEKVRVEKKGRPVFHRRSQSVSPVRIIIPHKSNASQGGSQAKQGTPIVETQQRAPSNPIEFSEPKGSVYARWVRQQSNGSSPKHLSKAFSFERKVRPMILSLERPTKPTCEIEVVKESPKGANSRFSSGRKVIPQKMGQEGPTKPTTTTSVIRIFEESVRPKKKNHNQETDGPGNVENKMQKVKGILLRYASIGKENREGKLTKQSSAIWKTSYFKKLSFKFKGNDTQNLKKKVSVESKMTIVQYKPRPKLPLCLGYVPDSPRQF